MTDDVELNIPDLIVEDSEIKVVEKESDKPVERKVSKWEEKALSQGWKPKDDYEGDPEDWRSAREFVERGELFGALSKTKAELHAMKRVYQEVEAKAFRKAIDELKSLQKEAIQNGDVDEATKLTDKIVEEQRKVPVVEDVIPEAAQAFIDRNKSWFNTSTSENRAMRQFACETEVELRNSNPHLSDADLYALVERDVKTVFSSKFEGEAKRPTSVGVASDKAESKAGSRSKSIGYTDLSQELKEVYNQLKDLPGITLDGLVKEWKKSGDL